MAWNINSAKLVIEIVDDSTGEIITREATLGDFKEVTAKKSTSSRSKKPKDDGDPIPKITLLEGKWQMNNACISLTGFEPEQKLDVKFEKNGRKMTPVLCEDEKSGNRLTKTYTVSCRGSKHDNLSEYGTVFEVIPHEKKEGCFKLVGDIQKEDDIIDVPEEITDLTSSEDDNEDLLGTSDVDEADFELEL